jgi:serpin B
MKLQLLLCLALVSSGHPNAQADPPGPQPPPAVDLPAVNPGGTSPDTRKVVAGNTQFAADLYGQLRAQAGNLCFSPYSISTALAMTCGGARGETEKQMARTLHFNLATDKLPPAFAALAANLGAVQQQGRVQLAAANSLWPQAGFDFLPDYLTLCQKFFGTSITPVDYLKDTEGARKTINGWVEVRTSRKILELLKPGLLNRSSRLVLVNAIYFKGQWARQFEAARTENEPFHRSLENPAAAPLMRQTGKFGYAEFPGLQVLELPYAGGELSMLLLLPREVDGLGRLETGLTPQQLTAWTADLPPKDVTVFLPRFKLTAEFNLEETLKSLGMSDAFDSRRADFSGMDGRKDLFISKVIHKAFVEVNEEGTEAAAATAVLVTFGGAPMKRPPIPVFRADHPFLFLIRANRTGSILFLGRVTDPTQ